MTLGVAILVGQFQEEIPFKVEDSTVRIAQFLTIILCLSTQSDILTSIRSFLLLGKGSNWCEIISEEQMQSSPSLWIVRIGIPNAFKLSQGLVVTVASFMIIVQSEETIDLLKNFTSLMIVSEFDNILFKLASFGYLGEELHQQTVKITDKDVSRSTSASDRERKNWFPLARLAFAAILFGMFTGWGIVLYQQYNGISFDAQFPGCGIENYELAFTEFGDEKCYGGPFNTPECKYENGDCTNFNTEFPSCNGDDLVHLHNVEDELGNNNCNMAFAIGLCEYDGGDCCPYEIHQNVLFGNGICDGGLYNTKGCLYDFGDCDTFNEEYPNCILDDELLKSESSYGIILGDGICDGGAYNSDECGFEFGDCVKAQIGGDIRLHGVRSPRSPSDNKIEFKMWMSADSTKLLIEMPQTNKVGRFDSNTNGKIAGHKYNSDILKWVNDEGTDKERLENDSIWSELHRMAVAGDGSAVAVGSPYYDDWLGSVTIFDFWGSRNHHVVLIGNETDAKLGFQMDMTGDGTRIALSSPFSDANGYISGKIQIFEKSDASSEEKWTQVGNDIIGKNSGDHIGYYYVVLNSLNGTRVYFSTGKNLPQLRIYQVDCSSQDWVELVIDTSTPISLQRYTDQKDLITISADGNRFAVSSYRYNPNSNSVTSVTIYDWTTNANGGSWNQLGPPISSTSNENGFGRSISMDDDGTLLAISAVDPNCDGFSRFEDQFNSRASTALCSTGSIQLYQYEPTNPPWRPFTRLPHILDINSQKIMETQHQVRVNTILGLQVSLSGDGSVLTTSGFDIDGDFGFVKVFTLKDLFYVDCLVHDLDKIGDGGCYDREPYYTEACGYDGGDCPLPSPVDGFDGCKVAYPSEIDDGDCWDVLPYNSKECGYDGGDCGPPSTVEGYPDCFVSDPEYITNDWNCNDWLPYNSYECGFDGDNCRPAEFNPTFSPLNSI